MHDFVTLLALIFTGVHILAVWIDPFTSFGWNEVFIPFVSHYRPVWMALGIVAFYLGIAIGLSTWLRPLIGYKWWRRLHVLTLLLYGLVLVHGITTGRDTRTLWGAAIYVVSILLVDIPLLIRLVKPANSQSRAHPILAVVLVVALLVGAILAIIGPFQAGWNAIANNGNGSGSASNALAAPAHQHQQQQNTLPQSFTSDLQGQFTQNGPDANGNVTLQLALSMSNGATGNVQVVLQGQTVGGNGRSITITSSHVTLTSSTGQELYTGSLTNFSGERGWIMTALLTGTGANKGSQLQVQMSVRLYQGGQVTGTITAASVTPTGTGV